MASSIVISQRASRPAAIISSIVFDFDVVFAAIKSATFLAVVDLSNSCTLICQIGLIAVVSYDCALQYIAIVQFAR